jgi:hypothetical protein
MRQSAGAGLSHRAFGRCTGIRHQSISAAIRDGRLIADAAGPSMRATRSTPPSSHATRRADDPAAQVASLVAKAALLR